MQKVINTGFVKDVKKETTDEIQLIHIAKIRKPNFVERVEIDRDGIRELADNINRNGLINPLTVRENDGKYEIIAGHRRYLALKLLGAKKVKCNVFKGTRDQLEMVKISENLHREDLTDMEEAVMLDRLKKLSKMNEKQLAKQIGMSESYVKQKLQIMKYPECVQNALASGEIVFSVARELIRLKNEGQIKDYLRHVVKNGATPNIVKNWVDDILHQEKIDKGIVKPTSGGGGGLQVQGATYVCWMCEETANLNDSQLYRIHHTCIAAAMKGE